MRCRYWGIAPVQCNFTWREMNDLTHCRSYTALANSSIWLNIDINTRKRERQGDACRHAQSHRRKTPLSLFFFITQMQIKGIHQVGWQARADNRPLAWSLSCKAHTHRVFFFFLFGLLVCRQVPLHVCVCSPCAPIHWGYISYQPFFIFPFQHFTTAA